MTSVKCTSFSEERVKNYARPKQWSRLASATVTKHRDVLDMHNLITYFPRQVEQSKYILHQTDKRMNQFVTP